MSGAQLFQNDVEVEVADLKEWKEFLTKNMSEIRTQLDLIEKLYEISTQSLISIIDKNRKIVYLIELF
jgi:hypothetical protein